LVLAIFAFMIIIDNKLVSDEVVEQQFVCDLNKCKGVCCEDGDAGAPLEEWELEKLDAFYELAKPHMTAVGIAIVEKTGKKEWSDEFGWVTPTINGGLCVYGKKDAKGHIICSFEKIYNEGQTDWKKPLSCHLFPIKISQSVEDPELEYVNYEPRADICAVGCRFGEKLKVPAYVFLKEALTRKYGAEFYETLDQIAKTHYQS
jgi:hypothetical protein